MTMLANVGDATEAAGFFVARGPPPPEGEATGARDDDEVAVVGDGCVDVVDDCAVFLLLLL